MNDLHRPNRLPASRGDLIAIAHADHDAELVQIDDDAIRSVAWPSDDLSHMTISLKGAVARNPAGALSFLLLMTSINYRFWRTDRGAFERYSHNGKTGARALWASFEAAWGHEEYTPALFAQRLASEGILAVFGDIPDVDSRMVTLNELLKGDLAAFCEQMTLRVFTSHSITVADAAKVANAFPKAFGDSYLKKAQLALSMYGAYLRNGGCRIDTTDLTAFADYQVPRVLRALGVLRYCDSLATNVDAGELIAPESQEERTIRASTIIACERIASHCGASASDVDNLLWQSQDVASNARFHLTETTWY